MKTTSQDSPAPLPVRVAIVDDHAAYRISLRALLSSAPGLQLIAACATGEAALRNLPDAGPAVVIMDLNISRSIDGVLCTRELRRLIPGVQVIIHTAVTDRLRVLDALRAGAVGYILKDEPQSVLISAIHQAASGSSPLSGTVARALVETLQIKEEDACTSCIELLTSREMQVLSATSQGARNKELAAALGVSPETIRNHLRHIFDKLQVGSRTEAAAIYWSQHSSSPALSVVAA